MRYFLPELTFQRGSLPVDKLGGLPWGMPSDLWPMCKACTKPQSLLAQFSHHDQRLDLGKPGRILYVFQCNHNPGICETWEGGSGANACFVLEPEEIAHQYATLPDSETFVETEAFIAQWTEQEDEIDPILKPSFFKEDRYWSLADSEREKPSMMTKLGSVPWWTQSPNEAPEENWRFVAQIASWYSFFTPPVDNESAFVKDTDPASGKDCWLMDGPNFGAGTGYVFLNFEASKPEGWFFWQS